MMLFAVVWLQSTCDDFFVARIMDDGGASASRGRDSSPVQNLNSDSETICYDSDSTADGWGSGDEATIQRLRAYSRILNVPIPFVGYSACKRRPPASSSESELEVISSPPHSPDDQPEPEPNDDSDTNLDDCDSDDSDSDSADTEEVDGAGDGDGDGDGLGEGGDDDDSSASTPHNDPADHLPSSSADLHSSTGDHADDTETGTGGDGENMISRRLPISPKRRRLRQLMMD